MVTSFYAALLALLLLGLAVCVIRRRWVCRVAIGDGNDDILRQRIRAHGNCSEYVPLFLILLGLAEYNHLSNVVLHALGMLFVIGRFFHAYSLAKAERYENAVLKSSFKYRSIGVVCTFTSIGVLATILLIQYLIHAL